jgi:hypothetical protein
MKKLLLILVLGSSISIIAQNKTVNISKTTIGGLRPSYAKSINLEVKDSIYYVYIGFENEKYSTISDSKSLFLTQDVHVKAFTNDLKTAKLEMETKQNIEWKKELYGLSLFDFSDKLYILESASDGSGYTTISKKDLEELIKWLESIEFGKG